MCKNEIFQNLETKNKPGTKNKTYVWFRDKNNSLKKKKKNPKHNQSINIT